MLMSRWIVTVMIVSLVSPTVAGADDALLASATRIARESVRKDPAVLTKSAVPQRNNDRVQAQETGGLFATPERGRTTKLFIGIGAATAFIASIWSIARNSEDVTPSTQGTRQDGCCPF